MTMPKTLAWRASLQVSEGPELSASWSLAIEAYGVIDAEVDVDTKDREILVQPGGGSEGEVGVLAILADSYEDLTFTVNSPSGDSVKPVTLDAPLILVGSGAVALLGGASPLSKLYFNNGSSNTVAKVQILVGREAVA